MIAVVRSVARSPRCGRPATPAAVLEELGREYVRTAKAKGLRFGAVINRHVMQNALLPALTVLGLQISVLLGGAVITEQIYAWPGVGQLAVQAVQSRDYT